VGLVSEDEHIDIDLTEPLSAGEMLERLGRAAPDGLCLEQAVSLQRRPDSLASRVGRVEYSFHPEDAGFEESLSSFMRAERWPVERRKKKNKSRTVDIRSFVDSVQPRGDGAWIVQLSVRGGATARLDELAEAWGLDGGLGPRAKRLGMYIEQEGQWARPVDAVEGVLDRAETSRREEALQ
jgi:radical SAM-linked protein